MTADRTLHVVGFGRLTAAILPRLLTAHPELAVTVVTRTPDRVRLPGVEAIPYPLPPGEGPVLIVTSADEGAVLQATPRAPGADVPRGAVLAANVAHLRAILDPAALRDRPLLVITNPVEAIGDFLHSWTGNPRIVGLGLATDEARLREVMRVMGWGAPPSLRVGGFHDSRPIPILWESPTLLEIMSDIGHVEMRLADWSSPYSAGTAPIARTFRAMADGREPGPRGDHRTGHEVLDIALKAVTISEFEDGRPPVKRPAETLAGSLIDYFDGRPFLASAPTAIGGRELLAGGTFDSRSFHLDRPWGDAIEERLLVETLETRRIWMEEAR